MNSTPTTHPQARPADPAFEQQLRAMNEALLVASVQQHELAEQARQAEAVAHESEERYRTLFDFVPVAVYACATSGVIQKFNRRAAELWGREPAVGDREQRFCGSYKSFRPDGSFMPLDQCPMADVLSGKLAEVRDTEVLIERPDGSQISIVVNIHPLKNPLGEITGAINCFHDITERKASEETLRQRAVELAKAQRETLETLALVDALISNAPIGMAYYDPDLRFVRLNQALADINGLPLVSHMGRTIPELLPGLPEKSLDQFRQVLATGRPILNYEVRGETPKAPGELRWWLVNYYPVLVPTEDGRTKETLGVGVAVLEITQQKRSEAALRESERNLRFVMDSIPQKIFTANPDGHIDYFNPQWTEFTGMSFEQMQDSGWTRFVHPDDLEEKTQHWRHAFDTGEPFESEHRFRRADGEYRWHFSRAVPMRDAAGRITMWVGSNTDVHDMKLIEAALQEQARELTDQHRRKDEFLAMLSHELRSPLAPISNAVQLLAHQRGSENPIQLQARSIIERQLGQLQHLVNDLLEVSRITTGRIQLVREWIDLSDIVGCAVETVHPLMHHHHHELAVSHPQTPIWMQVDPARLQQVLVNLLTNAAKYTTDGGRIWLSLRHEGHEVVLRVRDSGLGIAPELLPQVFDLFTQAERSLDRSQGGLGIGLCLVKRLVELHGGQVTVSSVVGQGSEFVVRLPMMRMDEPQPPPTKDANPSGSALRILVVDDNIDSAMSFSMLLMALGHEVRTAHDGLAAVEAALEYPPEVVLLDIGLPGLDGYEVAKRIRLAPALQNVMLIALTGYGQDSDRQLALQAGFNHHLVKPARLEQIQQILATVSKPVKSLSSGSSLTPTCSRNAQSS